MVILGREASVRQISVTMPPLTFPSFFLPEALQKRGDAAFPFWGGSGVSAIQVFPERKVPSIFPALHQFRTVRSERLCNSAH